MPVRRRLLPAVALAWVLAWLAPQAFAQQQPQPQPAPPVQPRLPYYGPRLPPGAQLPPANPQTQALRTQSAPLLATPIHLTPQQQADLEVVLQSWQMKSGRVSTLDCSFSMWEYDGVFGPADRARTESQGKVFFAAPDKGLYHVIEVKDYNQTTNTYELAEREGEHWMCDGEAIYEFNGPKKQLIERRLPPELQGKAISDGPLPFLFGVEAEKLKARYFMRIITPPNVADQVWLEAFPRYQQDAANFQRVEIILSNAEMLPHALQLYLPNGKSRTVYQFKNVKINGFLNEWKKWFSRPQTPLGWKRVVEEPNAPQGNPPSQALQPGATTQR